VLTAVGAVLLALIGLLAPAPVAAQTRDQATCLAGADSNLVAICNRFIEDVSRTIDQLVSGKARANNKQLAIYERYNLRGGAWQAMARRYAANADAEKARELSLRAIQDFDAAITLDPGLTHAFLNRSIAWAELGAFDRALADLDRAQRIDPSNPLVFNSRGGIYSDSGEFDKAIADFGRAIALKPKLAEAYVNRGSVYLQHRQYDRAIADLDAAVRYGARNLYVLAARGRAWRDLGDDQRAKADFEAALADPAPDQRSKAVQDALRELLRAVQEKIEREQAAARRKAELERIERERAEHERLEIQKAERERIEREQAEKAALAAAEKAAREKLALEQAARERAEREQAAREEAERREAAREKARLEQAARKQAELERIERERAERERAEREKAELAALELAKTAEREQAARERLERERAALEQAEREKTRARRVVLVIGNSAYRPGSLYPLMNPRNDAAAIAKAFEALDFTVLLGVDVDRAQTAELMERFIRAARAAETAVFFFAGHGMQADEVNYLAPVDADTRDLATFTNLQSVETQLQSEHGVRIMFIDACRTRPLAAAGPAEGLPQPRGNLVLGVRGLKAVAPSVPHGMLIAYAAAAGEGAEDGVRLNSPFTSALLKHLPTPGLDLRRMLARVRQEVIADTNGRQHPHDEDGLVAEEFYLKVSGP
jgi:tetratricopeptide (TPR) repeat protein